MFRFLALAVLAAVLGSACSSSGGGSIDAAGHSTIDASIDAASSWPTPVFGADGCLTFASASKFCGSASDDRVCNLSLSCATSSGLDQCHINCEMGATVKCYRQADVDCLTAATDAKSCPNLAACGFIL
ncbi:hypothetical protein BH11MYX2_BH11MYX2_39390 [soil metagenome]